MSINDEYSHDAASLNTHVRPDRSGVIVLFVLCVTIVSLLYVAWTMVNAARDDSLPTDIIAPGPHAPGQHGTYPSDSAITPQFDITEYVTEGLSVEYTIDNSVYHPDTVERIVIDFGDGFVIDKSPENTPRSGHYVYLDAGTYTASVTFIDTLGEEYRDSSLVHVVSSTDHSVLDGVTVTPDSVAPNDVAQI